MNIEFRFDGSENELAGTATYKLYDLKVVLRLDTFKDADILWQFIDKVYLQGRKDGSMALMNCFNAAAKQIY